MITLKHFWTSLAVVLTAQALWPETVHAQRAAPPPFREAIKKQETIYQSRGGEVPEGYSIDRSLQDYTHGLSSGFDTALANLGPADRWLDIGAGRGFAILDYYAPGEDVTYAEWQAQLGRKARAVAISIEDRRGPRWRKDVESLGENRIRYLFNRRLRDYSVEELGKFQVITDVIGGFSYTEDLSLFMEKTLGFLEVNGSFFTLLQDVHSEGGENRPFYPNSPFLTEIANPDGSKLKVCSWLKRITCVAVTCEFKTSWKPPVESYRIRKVCNDVSVPALAPIHFEAGTPPERGFQIRTNPPQAAPDQAGAPR